MRVEGRHSAGDGADGSWSRLQLSFCLPQSRRDSQHLGQLLAPQFLNNEAVEDTNQATQTTQELLKIPPVLLIVRLLDVTSRNL